MLLGRVTAFSALVVIGVGMILVPLLMGEEPMVSAYVISIAAVLLFAAVFEMIIRGKDVKDYYWTRPADQIRGKEETN